MRHEVPSGFFAFGEAFRWTPAGGMQGLGYLKPDPNTLTRFKAAYVSGPPEVGRRRASRDSGETFLVPYYFSRGN